MNAHRDFPLRRMVAPIVLILFVLGWYRFSGAYIQTDDASLLAHGNYAVYVPVQQVSAYMQAVTWVSYAAVFGGLILLWSGLVSYVEHMERSNHG